MLMQQLIDLDDKLANATAADLAGVTLDGLGATWPASEPPRTFAPDLATSMDRALDLIVQTLPDWTITLEGTEHPTGGHWSCVLREAGVRDDVEVLGIGRAASAALSMIGALLRIMIIRAKGYS